MRVTLNQGEQTPCRSKTEEWGSGGEQPLSINVQWFQSGLTFRAQTLLHHSTLGLRVTEKKKEDGGVVGTTPPPRCLRVVHPVGPLLLGSAGYIPIVYTPYRPYQIHTCVGCRVWV